MSSEDAQTIGWRLRQIRLVRRKSLEVVAGLDGISTGHLSRIERGERPLGAWDRPIDKKLSMSRPCARLESDSLRS